jgi:hypothetical protein
VAAAPASPDRETIARAGDHRALRIWLRLLTCTQLIERQVRSRLREQYSAWNGSRSALARRS